ncbi:two-component system KDP operon response regulator KdpE [Arcanobacterium pluranimalium]|uniref:response regulator transcription factor n=1 Tax=Arcanobacterium pluranimalium TaxID=108028 RepID=UPI0019569539|nr:response regulator transcription factor [Arcanobacterium pluranimalium]MBM7824312.1 two-component system KDP operon response regulator KdpE [Arcanobacterium pluranimalium]
MVKILVVEDDVQLASTLGVILHSHGYEVVYARQGAEAIKLASAASPQLVLLDLGLPDISGLDVLRTVRTWSEMPVVVVSARHEIEARINALDEGADDFVTKPFDAGELLARIRAALRRVHPAGEETPVIVTRDGWIEINIPAATLRVDGKLVKLTPTQWKIVSYLAHRHDRLVPQLELLKAVWGDAYEKETNYLRVFLSQIRARTEKDPSQPQYFITEAGIGYRFVL